MVGIISSRQTIYLLRGVGLFGTAYFKQPMVFFFFVKVSIGLSTIKMEFNEKII